MYTVPYPGLLYPGMFYPGGNYPMDALHLTPHVNTLYLYGEGVELSLKGEP